MVTDINDVLKYLQKKQSAKRFHHTLGVAYTATAMAMQFDVDIKSAEIAGLLHDCAKYMDDNKSLNYCKKYNLPMTEIEKRNPFLLHGKIGAHIAENRLGITEPDIINAIRNHTTGRPGMSKLEKIIFVADYIEPSRKLQPNLNEIRKLAFKDLDEVLKQILKDTLVYLKDKGGEIDPMTQQTYDYYCLK